MLQGEAGSISSSKREWNANTSQAWIQIVISDNAYRCRRLAVGSTLQANQNESWRFVDMNLYSLWPFPYQLALRGSNWIWWNRIVIECELHENPTRVDNYSIFWKVESNRSRIEIERKSYRVDVSLGRLHSSSTRKLGKCSAFQSFSFSMAQLGQVCKWTWSKWRQEIWRDPRDFIWIF